MVDVFSLIFNSCCFFFNSFVSYLQFCAK